MSSLVWNLLRVGLALLLGYAGAIKVIEPGDFIVALGHYQLVSVQVGNLLGFYVPWVEIGTAISLLYSRRESGGWLLIVCLGLGFTGFIASVQLRGLDIQCCCFGQSTSSTSDWLLLDRASDIATLALMGFIRSLQKKGETRQASKSRP